MPNCKKLRVPDVHSVSPNNSGFWTSLGPRESVFRWFGKTFWKTFLKVILKVMLCRGIGVGSLSVVVYGNFHRSDSTKIFWHKLFLWLFSLPGFLFETLVRNLKQGICFSLRGWNFWRPNWLSRLKRRIAKSPEEEQHIRTKTLFERFLVFLVSRLAR